MKVPSDSTELQGYHELTDYKFMMFIYKQDFYLGTESQNERTLCLVLTKLFPIYEFL